MHSLYCHGVDLSKLQNFAILLAELRVLYQPVPLPCWACCPWVCFLLLPVCTIHKLDEGHFKWNIFTLNFKKGKEKGKFKVNYRLTGIKKWNKEWRNNIWKEKRLYFPFSFFCSLLSSSLFKLPGLVLSLFFFSLWGNTNLHNLQV